MYFPKFLRASGLGSESVKRGFLTLFSIVLEVGLSLESSYQPANYYEPLSVVKKAFVVDNV